MGSQRRGRQRSHETDAATTVSTPAGVKLPKGALGRVKIGQSFAEYDPALQSADVYVHTPALEAAQDAESRKVFFVGRRGVGKTAIRLYCGESLSHSRVIVPEIFSPTSTIQELDLLKNTRARPFQSLVSAFRRALLVELLSIYADSHPARTELPHVAQEALEELEHLDFDVRCLRLIESVARPLEEGDEETWLRENKAARVLAEAMKTIAPSSRSRYTVLIDSIDDYWEGSDEGLTYLTAFMHACQEVTAQIGWARTILFLRENIFERVRSRDTESSRLETAVVGMEWTERQLQELVERRLNRNLTAKFQLNGATLSAFFEDSVTAWAEVMDHCQRRPRDVLIYVNNAVEAAQSAGHDRILAEDVTLARRRFSDNRLRDLGDEYAENYPQLSVVLSRFYGLGQRYTLGGMQSFIDKLLNDPEVARLCRGWIYENSSPEKFIRLLYNVGFVGLQNGSRPTAKFRSLGPQDTSPPPVSVSTDVVIHRCYWDSLDLQDVLVREIPDAQEFGKFGIISDLPGGVSNVEYAETIKFLTEQLDELAHGAAKAADFEEIVGDVVKHCFFRALSNLEDKSRSYDNRVIRDWVASNRAQTGFWAQVRERYGATQVIFECKNYANLSADDFHQAQYYMSGASGKFVVIVFRGEVSKANYEHIKRIHDSTDGLVLPLTEKDVRVFLRQALNGKIKEDHLQERFDAVVRKIS